MMMGIVDDDLDRVAAAVLAGDVVAYPTETFYALGADPRNSSALDRLSELKGRQQGKPFLLLVNSLAALQDWVADVPAELHLVAERFWPGPLTVVLPARPALHEAITGAEGKVALRLTAHPAARALVERCGVALTGTSANRAGEAPARTAAQVREAFRVGEVEHILDAGETAGGAPSTLVDLSVRPARILRRGAIGEEQIAAVIRLL
jgi:L-threonylcarbamoyladenylate synthase